jgi:hypothetical protein
MKKAAYISVCFLAILGFSTAASCRLALMPMSFMVENSERIVMGKVTSIVSTDQKIENKTFSKALIQVESVLKGTVFMQRVEVLFLPGTEDEPTFTVGEKGIFFVRGYKDKQNLLQGSAGKVDIVNGEAKNIYMRDEAPNQKIDQFLGKVKQLIKSSKKAQ